MPLQDLVIVLAAGTTTSPRRAAPARSYARPRRVAVARAAPAPPLPSRPPLARTGMRPPRPLGKPVTPRRQIAPQPLVAVGPTDPEAPAQLPHVRPLHRGKHHELLASDPSPTPRARHRPLPIHCSQKCPPCPRTPVHHVPGLYRDGSRGSVPRRGRGRHRPRQGHGGGSADGRGDEEGRWPGRSRRLPALARQARAPEGRRAELRGLAGGRCSCPRSRARHVRRDVEHVRQAVGETSGPRAGVVPALWRTRLRARPSDGWGEPVRERGDSRGDAAGRRASTSSRIRAAASSPRLWRASPRARGCAPRTWRCSRATPTASIATISTGSASWPSSGRFASNGWCASPVRRAARCSPRAASTPTCRS